MQLLRIFAWALLAVLFIVTVGPINIRPHIPGHVTAERFTMLLMIGMIFCFAYPRRWLTVLALLIGSAAVFELLQRITPDRHGELSDFLVKTGGAISGVLLAKIILFWKSQLK